MNNPGDDAKALIRRAKKHRAEFKAYCDGKVVGPLWNLNHKNAVGGVTYRLELNRHLLIELKPVLADIANNVVHSLDLLVGDLLKAQGIPNDGSTYFPWIEREADFNGALKGLSKKIGAKAASAIGDVRRKWEPHSLHIHAIKKVSNTAKHWELVPAAAGAAAISWLVPGGQPNIWEIPKDAFENGDSYELKTVPAPMNSHCYIVMSFGLIGLAPGFSPNPDTVIDYAMLYAEQTIAEVYP